MKVKKLTFILLLSFGIFFQATASDNPKHAHVLNPEEEVLYFKALKKQKRIFPRLNWNECSDYRMTGNYLGYSCSKRRSISVILFEHLTDNVLTCIEEASSTLNYTVRDFHLVHKGIFADARHSPRSLHSEGRAIDLAEIKVRTFEKGWITFNYLRHGKGKFFKSFRDCWGSSVHFYNGCPLHEETLTLTGSIGKENQDHQRHLHLSIPYCHDGKYLGDFYKR